jgi:hypothetical protein
MSEGHSVSKEIQELLFSKGKTLADVEKAFENKKEELKNKRHITEKRVWSKKSERVKRTIGRSIYLVQSNFPLKMFVFQETFMEGAKEPEIRLGYYLVSPMTLKREGRIKLVWGQYNPNIPKKDLVELMRIAREKGIIEKT